MRKKHNLKVNFKLSTFILLLIVAFSCSKNKKLKEGKKEKLTAAKILGNPDYLAISYGGYRENSREIQPTIEELKEDIKILSALGIRVLRTYNVHFAQTANLLEAIRQLKKEYKTFEMYVMLGAWIDCKNAFYTNNSQPDHTKESHRNSKEIATAVSLAKEYPSIVKIIAVGNEAMVKWATSYYVEPNIVLKMGKPFARFKEKRKLI